ncbi:hypothetical protein K2X89_09320 [Myxococcota bacterium]|nr:hypothetical protein [Myxococcota bacterium]
MLPGRMDERLDELGIDEGQFEDFVFGNPVRLWAGMNLGFFEGAVVEGAANKRLARG